MALLQVSLDNQQKKQWHTLSGASRPEMLAKAIDLVRQLDKYVQIRQSDEASSAITSAFMADANTSLALLFGVLDDCFPNEQWDVRAHHYLASTLQSAQQLAMPRAGMMLGLAGWSFTTWLASHHRSRYHKVLATLEEQLRFSTDHLIREMKKQQRGFDVNDFDVISGLAGIGAYYLSQYENHQLNQEELRDIVTCLIRLAHCTDGVPDWYTPGQYVRFEFGGASCPSGFLNCGLAHGIPGPLALLALVKSSGVVVAGLDGCIDELASWLVAQRMDDQWGINWPSTIPVNPLEIDPHLLKPARSAWCYGTPGIARALWLAGRAINNPTYCTLAIDAMRDMYAKPRDATGIISPPFCHGVAGLLQITLRFANDTNLPQFWEAANSLLDQLLAFWQPSALLGFHHLGKNGTDSDDVGLLNGVVGIILVLLAATVPNEPQWDRMFVLA